MDVLFGFEVPRRKRLRNEPGVVSTPCLVRGEPMCFLKLRGEATGIGLAMLFFKEAVSLRACSSEICSWLRPATPFMRAFMQCSPVGCLLRSCLAIACPHSQSFRVRSYLISLPVLVTVSFRLTLACPNSCEPRSPNSSVSRIHIRCDVQIGCHKFDVASPRRI